MCGIMKICIKLGYSNTSKMTSTSEGSDDINQWRLWWHQSVKTQMTSTSEDSDDINSEDLDDINQWRLRCRPSVSMKLLVLAHTCDIFLFRRNLPTFCPFLRKSPYQNFRISFYILYISLFGISGLPTKIWEFPPLFNHSPYLKI